MSSKIPSFKSIKGELAKGSIVIIGLSMILLGILFVTIASFGLAEDLSKTIQIMSNLPHWIFNALSHLGSGLVAAGLLTTALEHGVRKRHSKDILEIKNAHAESLLKEIIPQPFFNEIKFHMIQQPFIRSNYQAVVQLDWKDWNGIKNQFLSMSDIYSYQVENISHTSEEYSFKIYEDKVYEDKFPNCTKIKELKILRVINGSKFEEFTNIEKEEIETPLSIEVNIRIHLNPNEKSIISQQVDSMKSVRDMYTYVMNKPTVGLHLTVIHPKDLILSQVPMYSAYELSTDTHTSTLKIWHIRTGILPFQGLLLSWSLNDQIDPNKT